MYFLVKTKENNASCSLVLSTISVIISVGLIIGVVVITNKITNTIKEGDFEEELKSGLTQLYNGLSEGITDELNVPNKLEGYSWKAADGSLLKLNYDGTYCWYKDADDKTDNYYVWTYTSYLGDRAIEKIDKKFGFNEEAYSKNFAILIKQLHMHCFSIMQVLINVKV